MPVLYLQANMPGNENNFRGGNCQNCFGPFLSLALDNILSNGFFTHPFLIEFGIGMFLLGTLFC